MHVQTSDRTEHSERQQLEPGPRVVVRDLELYELVGVEGVDPLHETYREREREK